MTGSQEQAAEPVAVFDIVGHKEGYVRYGGAMNGQQSLRKRAGKRRNKGGEGRERVTKHDRCDICRKSYLTMLLMQCKQSHELPALSILSYFTLLTVARHMAHSSYSWRAREALEALIRAFTLSGSSDKACTQVSLALAYSFMLR